MTEGSLRHAKDEVHRFLQKVSMLEAYFKRNPDDSNGFLLMRGSKYSGAVRRASMDLTRALADLRR